MIDTDLTGLPATIAGADGPQCICGNHAASDGFYPVDEQGRDVEPTPQLWLRALLRCNRQGCDLVIDQDGFDPLAVTFPVIGRIVPDTRPRTD